MQLRTVMLIAIFAPHSAAAFGNLDCIAIESCIASNAMDQCSQISEPFSVTFDWGNEAAIVTANGVAQTLDWARAGESDDTLSSIMQYGDIEAGNRLLRIEANGMNITAYYTFEDSELTKWTGVCNVRQAA